MDKGCGEKGGEPRRPTAAVDGAQQAAVAPAAAEPAVMDAAGDPHLQVVMLVVVLLAWLAQWTLPACTC